MSAPLTPVSAVPRRMRLICAIAAAVVVGVMLVVGVLLKSTANGVVVFRTSDQVAMVGLGVVMGAGILLLGRPRVDADAEQVRVRNIVGTHTIPWTAVRAVRFERSSSWATLALANDDEIAVLAVQAADRMRAVEAVEGLRRLLAASQAAERAQRPDVPLLYDD